MRFTKRSLVCPAAALAGFCAGLALHDRLSFAAFAASEAPQAQIIDLSALPDDQIGAPPAVAGGVRSRPLVMADGAGIAVQVGNPPKHYHADSIELQYVLEGSGSMWLGDQRRDIKPGDIVIIPKGVAHGGTQATSGRFKMISIKTPPQAQTDVHLVP